MLRSCYALPIRIVLSWIVAGAFLATFVSDSKAQPAPCPEGCWVGTVSVASDQDYGPSGTTEETHSWHDSYELHVTEADDFNLGSIRAGSYYGSAEPAILNPEGSFHDYFVANSSDNNCGRESEATGKETTGFETEDRDSPLELRFLAPPEGPTIATSYLLSVAGIVVPLKGTETSFGEANPYCNPGEVQPIETLFNNIDKSVEEPMPSDITHLEGSRLLIESDDAEANITERITWNLQFVHAPDFDGDGLSDFLEVLKYGTNPEKADTDGDGYSDGEEVAAGTNPLDPNSYPGSGGNPGGGNPGDGNPGGGNSGGSNPGSPGGSTGGAGSTPGLTATISDTGSGQLVLDCGRAKFEYFAITHESTGIKKGDHVCAVLVSNEVAQELLGESLSGFSALPGVFSAYFLKFYLMSFGHESETAADAYIHRYINKKIQPINLGSELLKKLFSEFGDAFSTINGLVSLGKVVALNAIPLAALFEADQVENKGACAGFLLDLTPSRISASGTLAYNPNHVVNLKRDGYLTRVNIYERHQRLLRGDSFQRRNFSLTCEGSGLAKRDSPRDNAKLLSNATIKVIKLGQ